MSVFVTSYEVTLTGLPVIEQHNAAVKAWKEAAWKVVEELGGTGFRPCTASGISAVAFDDKPPTGWRSTARDPREHNKFLCVPRQTTVAGKTAKQKMVSVGKMPDGSDAAALFGWNPSTLAIDSHRGIIYFPTAQTIELPSPRHFIRLPRFADDGWQGHEGLKEVPESEYMRAIEAHNAAVQVMKSERAAA